MAFFSPLLSIVGLDDLQKTHEVHRNILNAVLQHHYTMPHFSCYVTLVSPFCALHNKADTSST